MLRFILGTSSFCLAFLFSSDLVIDSFIYNRSCVLENKTFQFPSFELAPPTMLVGKINQHLTPLSSFLNEKKVEFSYISENSHITFALPFSSSFYYSIPLTSVKTFDLAFFSPREIGFALDFESFLDYSAIATDCQIDHLSLNPYFKSTEIKHPLSAISFSYNQLLLEQIPKEGRINFTIFTENYLPYSSLDELNLNTIFPSQEKFSIHIEKPDNQVLAQIKSSETSTSLISPKILFREKLKTTAITIPYKNICNIAVAKVHSPIINALTLPILYGQSPSLEWHFGNLLVKNSSPKKESAILYNENHPLSLPNLSCSTIISNKCFVKSTPNQKANFPLCKTTPLSYTKPELLHVSNLAMPTLRLSSNQNLLNTKNPYLAVAKFELVDTIPKISSPSIGLKINKSKKKFISHQFKTTSLTIAFTSPSLEFFKKSISFQSHLALKSPALRSNPLKSPYQIIRARPTINIQKPLSYFDSSISLTNLKLASKFSHHHLIKLTRSAIPFSSQSLETTTKPILVASLSTWAPDSLPLINISSPRPLKKPRYTSAKEPSINQSLPRDNSIVLTALTKTTPSQYHFIVSDPEPKLICATLLPSIGKKFLTYNLSDSSLNTLVSSYSKNITSPSKAIFTYHEAILSAFKESSQVKEKNSFASYTCSFSLPEKISHKIFLPKTSKSFDNILNDTIVHLDPKYRPKEGVFPEKRFLHANHLTSPVPLYYNLPSSLARTSQDASLINTSITPTPSTTPKTLVELNAFATQFMPNVTFDKMAIPLENSRDLSSFSFIAIDAASINRENRYILQYLSELPSLEILQTYSLNDDFRIDSHFLQKPDKNGYSISLQISPYDHECLDPIPQKIYYIIDRSSSIETHRFNAFKNGLIQSLAHLHESSTYNIISFDQSWEKLSSTDLKPTKSSIQTTKKNLEKVNQKLSSSFTTLLSALETLQKQAELSSEPHTVILLTDGHFLKNLRLNRESFNKLFHTNTDNFSIFTAAISDNNNTYMLELMAKLGRGEYLYSQTHAAFPRKLAVLIKRLQRPIASDLRITLLDPKSKINFCHNTQTAPLLFSDKLYNIYGETEKLETIDLIIQGKSGDKWINIVKKIDLAKAEKAKTIDKELASKKALTHIINFVFTNNQNELLLAKQLIQSYDLKYNIN